MFTLLSFLLLCSFNFVTKSCIIPTGLNFNNNPSSGEIDFFSLDLSTSNLGLGAAINDDLQFSSETPIAFRRGHYTFLGVINALQSFDPISLDAFARVNISNSRKICFNLLPANLIEAYYTVTGTFAGKLKF